LGVPPRVLRLVKLLVSPRAKLLALLFC